MKKLGLFFLLIAGCCLSAPAQSLTAFPGAEGFGKFTTGGRGGVVYYVTSLDDCSDTNLVPGTLRWALRDGDEADLTPRTILFKVCGTICLTSKLKLNHPNVTIAGQTAPGGGICIAGANIYVCKPNVIIRYVRFRAGDVLRTNFPCLDVENTKNVIIDHCSLTWSMEECLTMYDCDSTTVQWSIIGEGLYSSYHNKGQRSYATQWGGEHSTMHHCLITNCYSRSPRFNGVRDEANLKNGKHDHDAQVVSEFVNNVIFNWGKKNSAYGGECDTTKNKSIDGVLLGYNEVHLINNYFKAGPTTYRASLSSRYFVQASDKLPSGQWLLMGNMFETGNKWNQTSKSVWTDANLKLVNNDNLYGFVEASSNRAFNINTATAGQASYDKYIIHSRRDSSQLPIEATQQAYQSVCAGVGPRLPRMDEEDSRLVAEAAGTEDPKFHGTAQKTWLGIIDGPSDITFQNGNDLFYVTIGGRDSLVDDYPLLDAIVGDGLVLDTDEDGMPDVYESANGLNPNDASDGALATADGYTNLEVYLNGVVAGTIDKTLYETLPYQSKEPTALENVTSTENPTKFVRQGQTLIRTSRGIFASDGKRL